MRRKTNIRVYDILDSGNLLNESAIKTTKNKTRTFSNAQSLLSYGSMARKIHSTRKNKDNINRYFLCEMLFDNFIKDSTA
jgi:hypothetical protein